MCQHDALCCQRSMKRRESRCYNHGEARISTCCAILCGILLCLVALPQCTEAAFTCPTGCACVTWKLYGVSKVQNITCTGTNLTQVPKDGKEGADIYSLDLSSNQISSVAATDFQYFLNIAELNLSFNNLSSIPPGTFTNVTSLQTLDLSHCNLDTASKSWFKNMNYLKKVNLGNNYLMTLPENLFKDNNVENIDFSHNQLTTVHKDFLNDADPLTNLTTLTIVDLSNNQITALDHRVFRDAPNIESLNLRYNQLSSLPANIFEDNKNMKTLDLANNLLTTLDPAVFQPFTAIFIDVSGNPFMCDCDVRDFLFEFRYDPAKAVLNEDQTFCTNSTNQAVIYLDFWNDTCSGNLGSSCIQDADCRVRNSYCNSTTTYCRCNDAYYDNNGVMISGGLCRPKVKLDYPCEMNDACLTPNAECLNKLCQCTSLYYDTNPAYLDGSCELKKELGGSCTMDSMCLNLNSLCDGTSNECVCQANYYDNNNSTTPKGDCLPKLDLYAACNESYQCGTENAECQSNYCTCSSGFWDLLGIGKCQVSHMRHKRDATVLQWMCKSLNIPMANCGPTTFYSCSPDNSSTDSTEVHFSVAKNVASETECQEYCFKEGLPHYLMKSSVCVCGDISPSGTCCPYVQLMCNLRNFIGPNTRKSEAGISITHVPMVFAGFWHQFSVTTTLNVIDEIRWQYGDSNSITKVAGVNSTVQHTYTHSGLFWLTVSACMSSVDQCENAVIPVRVQVPPANLTTYITGINKADVSTGLTNIFATFGMGYDFSYIWSKTDASGTTMNRKGCEAGWSAHRYTCIKLETSARLDFNGARTACMSLGGQLLQIDFLTELSEIITTLGATSHTFLLGGQRIGGVWQWRQDGSKTVFSDADLDTSLNGNCVVLQGGTGTLNIADCSASAKYACMKEPVSCPQGGNLHSNGYCYVLSSMSNTWSAAHSHCQTEYGGWLANITDEQVHDHITNMLTSTGIGEVWFGLSDQGVEGYYVWADDSSFNFYNPPYMPQVLSNSNDCFASTSAKQWYSDRCTAVKHYICQYSETIEQLTVPSYINGVPDLGIPAGTNLEQLVSTDTFSQTNITTEAYLFPGLIFTKEATVRSWILRSISLAATDSFDISLQLYRPYCSTGTLVQPGCSHTMFATCAFIAPSCTANTCTDSEYFCYLSNKCHNFNESCTCNSESTSTPAIGSCNNFGTAPQYMIVGQTQITVGQPGERFYKIPAGDIPIREHDIIGFQVPQNQNVLKCDDVHTGENQQTVYKASHTGWLELNKNFPTATSTVENMTCYLQAFYTTDVKQYFPQNIAYSSTTGDYELSISIIGADADNVSVLLEESVADIVWVYPAISVAPSAANSLGTVYTEWNKVYNFTVSVGRGTNVESVWSFDDTKTIPMSDICASEVTTIVTDSCNASLFWNEKPFATFEYTTTTTGNMILSINFTNVLEKTEKLLYIQTEKAISGVSFSLTTSSRYANTVAINRMTQFDASITKGTGVAYTFTVDGTSAPATNSTLFYTFTSVKTYIVEALVNNIIGSHSDTLTIYAKQPANFTNCVFIGHSFIAAVGIPLNVSLQCTVFVGAEVEVIWMLNDRSTNLTTAVTMTTTSTQVWSKEITFTTVQSGIQLTAFAADPFVEVGMNETVDVYNAIPNVDLVVSSYQVYPGDSIDFQASVPATPGSYGDVVYSFDFSDGTPVVASRNGSVSHSFTASGNFSVIVKATNGPSEHTYIKYIEVYDTVQGLALVYNGPQQINQPVQFTASTTGGNFLTYKFSSADFNVTQTSAVFSHMFTVAADYIVTVTCYNALSEMNTTITAFIMNPTDIRLSPMKVDGVPYTGCIESGKSYDFSVDLIHYDANNVVYDWYFATASVMLATADSMQTHSYSTAGNNTINVTAKYATASSQVTETLEVCVEEAISTPNIQITSPQGLPASGSLTKNITATVIAGSNLHYSWSTNATGGATSDSDVFSVMFTSEGWYEITLTVYNNINSETDTTVVQVVTEVSGLTVMCSSCTELSGELYVQSDVAYDFSVSIASGTSVTYSWDFGDSTTSTGATTSHTYTAVGQYNMTVTATNPVSVSSEKTILVHVEVLITDVTLSTHLSDWKVLSTTVKVLDILKTAALSVEVTPTGMDVTYDWVFDTGLSPQSQTSNINYYNYTTIGKKSCVVTARNMLNSMASNTLEFYILEEITHINLTGNGNVLSTSKTNIVAVKENYTFTVVSDQIVPEATKYTYLLMETSLLVNTVTTTYLTQVFDQEITYTLKINLDYVIYPNFQATYTIEAVKPISGAYITTPTGADGNITLGSSFNLTVQALQGKYLQYYWFYSLAPAGEAISGPTNNSEVMITPGNVGIYVITAEIYNSVSSPQRVNYTLNVMYGVSGVSIDNTLPYTGAIKQGTTITFNAVVALGTDLTYTWKAEHSGTVASTGSGTTFIVDFSSQAIYNITLYVENYASSEIAFMEIYSLYEVPVLEVSLTGGLYLPSFNKFVAITGNNLTITSNISNTDFIDFDWQVNGTSSSTDEVFTHAFSSPSVYQVSLDAANKISQRSSDLAVIIQDAVTGLTVQFCHATFEVSTSITLVATTLTGTDVSYRWEGSGQNSTTSSIHVFNFPSVGFYNINVTALNYVSQSTEHCMLTILGRIANLALTHSQYSFIMYPITFNVSGDFLDPANFTWVFSHGVTQVTTSPTYDIIIMNKGTYTVTVTVVNAVSNDTVTITFDVEDLVCNVTRLTVDGSPERITFRARPVELAVSVSTSGCTSYTSVNKWNVYQAASCAEPLANLYPLDFDIETSTPVLQLPGAYLGYGNYCVTFTHKYANTPVQETKSFNLSIEASDLKALIKGGDEISAIEGSTLTLDATESYDPDNTTGTTLTYSWTCTQTMGTSAAAAVCNQINGVTNAMETLSGLTLTSGDVYTVKLTVSSSGRTSGNVTQKVSIVSSTTPIVSIRCVSCVANGHFYLTTSRSLSIEGTCLSGCTSATIYKWTVRQSSTNSFVNLDSAMTTTGLDQQNFVLKGGALPSPVAYTFTLEATEGTEVGYALFTLPPSSKPSGGSCDVSPRASILPITNVVKINCRNFHDSDLMSGIYYEITVSNTNAPDDKYLAYFGTRAENEIYVAPFDDSNPASVLIEVRVVNDNGAAADGLSSNVSFELVTLTGAQNDSVDFIVDQMVAEMRTIVNQNNPVLLVQYCTAVLSYLNIQSEKNVSTIEKKMAIRELIAMSLAGLPKTSIHSIQQLSSAIKYLTAYPEELSLDTLKIINVEIESLAERMESIVIQGHDQSDYQPDNLLNAVNKVQAALRSTSTYFSDQTTFLKFGDLNDYILDVSKDVSLQSLSTNDMIIKTVKYSTQLMLVPLKAQLANEDPIVKQMSDGSVTVGMHVSTDNFEKQYNESGIKLMVPSSVLSHISYSKDSVFQLISAGDSNPYDFSYRTVLPLNTKTLSLSFYDTDGSSLSVSNLPANESIQMYMFHESVTPYTINTSGLVYSDDYNPLINNFDYTKSSILEADIEFEAAIPLPSIVGVAVNIQIRVNYTTSQSLATLKATLYKNGHAYTDTDPNIYARPLTITKDIIDEPQYNHRAYTFYVPPSDISLDDAFKVRVKTSSQADVFIGTYNTKCEFFNLNTKSWDSTGCTPQAESIPSVISCQCNHLTSFGGSLFVSPDQIDFTDLTKIDIASNPVAIITCSVVLGLYIIVVIACRKLDLMDIKRISLIPLCGKDGSFKYEVTIVTGRQPGAGTSAHVGVRLFGEYGKSARQHMSKDGAFQRNCSDTFQIAYDVNLGVLRKVQIWHDNSGLSPSWYLSHLIVKDLQTDQKYYFFVNRWLTLEDENGSIQRDVKVAGSHDINRFGHRMNTALFNCLADKHLWISLLNRPAHSRFTRVQRATCCVTILFIFIGVNAMWYGLLKKSNVDLGWSGFGWEEVVLGIVSNLFVLPFSIGLVFLFKNSRAKVDTGKIQKPQTAQTLEIENLCGESQPCSFESSTAGGIPYDLERESTIESTVPQTTGGLGGLRRTRKVAKTHRENTDDSLLHSKRPAVSVTNPSSKSPLWNEEGIMHWPEQVPTYNGEDSRPSTSSTVTNHQASLRHLPMKAGGSTPGERKHKSVKGREAANQLLAELDKLENDMEKTESKSVKSSDSHRSNATSNRKHSMQKWGSIDDILHSDDESEADGGKPMVRKRGSMTSHKGILKKFNPRSDARIHGSEQKNWLKTRDSVISSTTAVTEPFNTQDTGITGGLRPAYYNEMTMESRDIQTHDQKMRCALPSWCIYVGYVLCMLLSVFSIIMVILYCFKFGYEESVKWMLAFLLSLFMSVIIIEPIKVLIIAVYVLATCKSVEQDEDEDCIKFKPSFDKTNEKLKDVKFKPISGFALLQAKEEGHKIHRMKVMIRQFIAYIFYLWLLIVIVNVHFRYDSFLFTQHLERDFFHPTTSTGQNFSSINTIDEFWDWTENSFIDSLYLEDSMVDEEHAFLLGAARLRQIRGITSRCGAAGAAASLGASVLTDRTCHGDGQYQEDTGTYGEGWNGSHWNGSWKHFSASELGSTHKLGHIATYPGGGYPQVLGTTYFETLTIIQDLKANGWVDLLTRAVIFEFSLYSPGSDMTAMIAMLVEMPLTGGIITSYEIQSQKLLWFQNRQVDPLMVLQCILLLVVVYSWIHIGLQIRERGKQFFKEFWNYYEMLTTLMATVSIGMYIGCVVEATNTFNHFVANQTDFTNFERVTYVHAGTRYLQAWLLFLLIYKVVKQLRFVKFMHIYEKTLSRAVGLLFGAGLIFFILLLMYAQLGYLMYGRIVEGFESVWHAVVTLIVMIRGHFHFWPMFDTQPVFSLFYVYSYYSFAYGILVALVIVILQTTYKLIKSQQYYKASLEMQDYEMIEFIMKRFKLWSGMRKEKPAFRRVKFQGLPSMSSRSSSSYSNRSGASLHSSQSIPEREFSQIQLNSMMARLAPTWQAVLNRIDKIVALDTVEDKLVQKAEDEMKELNWKCRINELERQTKDILNWKNPPAASDCGGHSMDIIKQQKHSILKRLEKENTDRKAPATVSGAISRTADSTSGSDNNKNPSNGRRPFSDQGARTEAQASSSQRRSSSQERGLLKNLFESVKPSKPAWNK